MGSERRRAPRYPFIAEAEITEIDSVTKLRARTSDLSLSGCFLDMMNPSPLGTKIQISISHENTTFTVFGRVAFVCPNMGMGVAFTKLEHDQLPVLHRWVSKLSGSE